MSPRVAKVYVEEKTMSIRRAMIETNGYDPHCLFWIVFVAETFGQEIRFYFSSVNLKGLSWVMHSPL